MLCDANLPADSILTLPQIINEMARIIESQARPFEDGWCHSLFLDAPNLISKPIKGVDSGGSFRPSAERGELVWIDLNINGVLPCTLDIRDLLKMQIAPVLEGIGEIGARHTSKGLVIFRR